MKFTYGYKNKDNEMCEGEICAPSRDAVYRELRQHGIKPFKVDLAPGFGNWLASLGKRTYAIIVLAVLCVALAVTVGRVTLDAPQSDHSPQYRHQIYGDPALMDELARTDYATVFPRFGERLLARYAQPGQIEGLRNAATKTQSAEALAASAAIPDEEAVVFKDDDAREVRELKRIVLWMRGELRNYLANGVGTPERYLQRLDARQKREAQVYFTAQNDLKGEKSPEKWDRINGSLRAMGLKTIPAPADFMGEKN